MITLDVNVQFLQMLTVTPKSGDVALQKKLLFQFRVRYIASRCTTCYADVVSNRHGYNSRRPGCHQVQWYDCLRSALPSSKSGSRSGTSQTTSCRRSSVPLGTCSSAITERSQYADARPEA